MIVFQVSFYRIELTKSWPSELTDKGFLKWVRISGVVKGQTMKITPSVKFNDLVSSLGSTGGYLYVLFFEKRHKAGQSQCKLAAMILLC